MLAVGCCTGYFFSGGLLKFFRHGFLHGSSFLYGFLDLRIRAGGLGLLIYCSGGFGFGLWFDGRDCRRGGRRLCSFSLCFFFCVQHGHNLFSGFFGSGYIRWVIWVDCVRIDTLFQHFLLKPVSIITSFFEFSPGSSLIDILTVNSDGHKTYKKHQQKPVNHHFII